MKYFGISYNGVDILAYWIRDIYTREKKLEKGDGGIIVYMCPCMCVHV